MQTPAKKPGIIPLRCPTLSATHKKRPTQQLYSVRPQPSDNTTAFLPCSAPKPSPDASASDPLSNVALHGSRWKMHVLGNHASCNKCSMMSALSCRTTANLPRAVRRTLTSRKQSMSIPSKNWRLNTRSGPSRGQRVEYSKRPLPNAPAMLHVGEKLNNKMRLSRTSSAIEHENASPSD